MNPALTSDIQARFYRPLTDHEVDISSSCSTTPGTCS
jgi:hypothetical protein